MSVKIMFFVPFISADSLYIVNITSQETGPQEFLILGHFANVSPEQQMITVFFFFDCGLEANIAMSLVGLHAQQVSLAP